MSLLCDNILRYDILKLETFDSSSKVGVHVLWLFTYFYYLENIVLNNVKIFLYVCI